MNVIHGFWLPDETEDFIQEGTFFIWVESDRDNGTEEAQTHPRCLLQEELVYFLEQELSRRFEEEDPVDGLYELTFPLPEVKGVPLPSPELASLEEASPVRGVSLEFWQVEGFALRWPLKELNEIAFYARFQAEDTVLGADFRYWHDVSMRLQSVIQKDQYGPALLLAPPSGRKKKKADRTAEVYTQWKLLSAEFDVFVERAADAMPLVASVGYQPASLLRHFAQVNAHTILTLAAQKLPKSFTKKANHTLLQEFVEPQPTAPQLTVEFDELCDWHHWWQKLRGGQGKGGFLLGFQLQEASPEEPDRWVCSFFLQSQKFPSSRLFLSEYWSKNKTARKKLQRYYGKLYEQEMLLQLGRAARMAPLLKKGLDCGQPAELTLTLEEAFSFLRESAWLLEHSGFKVLVPSWWTPKGRSRMKLRMQASAPKKQKKGAKSSQGMFQLKDLLHFRYELSIGGHPVSEKEWRALLAQQAPLVHFRGEWMELERDKMQEMLDFWEKHNAQTATPKLQSILKSLAEEHERFEVAQGDPLGDLISGLHESSRLERLADPPALNGTLRAYQSRGVAWLNYLEQLGLNGCLADDMGLGKTVQVIANLLLDEEDVNSAPTLIIAPTSVLGNWQREIERFAPTLRCTIHHGAKRARQAKAFGALCEKVDVIISSYALARLDNKVFKSLTWKRIVLDEAQNIKTPTSGQTKAILQLQATHRLALTGTPIENRLMDLWSIFQFLNPGFLGKQAQFRKKYELPIQRDHDPARSLILKKLVQPFILRRLKTDKDIITDLPDKIENKQYCQLSQEQALLYEGVVQDTLARLDELDGIERQGLVLSTLMKLKQVCNHPAQFLQDASAFTPERSLKMERLSEMLETVVEQGESALIFTQFTEIGEKLERYLKREKHFHTHYLHGGTSRKRREQMIQEFQEEDSGPRIFVLSLKAGGVGITLTRANHVFHFDRWWNPAVEEQATDRAFRIGQTKKVFVHKFITLGTLEERIDQMLEDKKQMAQSVIGADESWLAKLDNEAFKDLILLNKQEIQGGGQ